MFRQPGTGASPNANVASLVFRFIPTVCNLAALTSVSVPFFICFSIVDGVAPCSKMIGIRSGRFHYIRNAKAKVNHFLFHFIFCVDNLTYIHVCCDSI